VTGPARGEPSGRAALSAAGVLTIGQVLEVTIGLLRRRWRTGLSLALLFVAPGAIVSSYYGMRANETADGVMPELDSRVLDGGRS
jgi:hypothetical protein